MRLSVFILLAVSLFMNLVLSTNNGTVTAVDSFTTRTFKSKKELFQSKFWKEVQYEYDNDKARSVVIYIEETKSIFYISDVKLEAESLSSNPFRKSKKKRIKLTEVQYGDKEMLAVEDIPISFCISSRLSSGGASYTQSYRWSQGLQLIVGPTITAGAALLGAKLSAGNDALTLTFANSGSITCIADPGKRVQVFGSFAFASFPQARKRDAFYQRGEFDLDTGPWQKLMDVKSEFSMFGTVFFDLTRVPNYYCVDQESKLVCDREQIVDKNTRNPMELLKYARKIPQ